MEARAKETPALQNIASTSPQSCGGSAPLNADAAPTRRRSAASPPARRTHGRRNDLDRPNGRSSLPFPLSQKLGT